MISGLPLSRHYLPKAVHGRNAGDSRTSTGADISIACRLWITAQSSRWGNHIRSERYNYMKHIARTL